MTSLAKQLQRLAVPHTQSVLGEDKRRASLLFDPKEAASIDRETFHSLGLNGLEELESIDEAFAEFETSLFGDSSLTFERSVQTKEVNEKLDAAIQRFLIQVSPYCLLKPAHKAIEWLIQRFHIHYYNTDDLLLSFLPYHESKIFVRVLQLIKFDAKIATKWDFLEPLQKSGVHLSRKTLVNHCATDPAFFSFICNMVPHAVKVLSEDEEVPKCRVLFSFYATTVIGVLDSTVTEVILSTLLPHLSRGLKSSVLEYKAASYMILAQLLYKTRLKTDLLKTFQHLIAKSMVGDLLNEAISCLMLMFQTQQIDTIYKKTFKYMCRHYSVVDVIAQLYTQFEAAQFLSGFLERLIPAAFKHAVGIATSGESSESESSGGLQDYVSLLHRLLASISLPDEAAEKAAYHFLSVFIKHGSRHLDNDVDDKIKDSLQGIVRQLEGKHSAAVDRAVTRTLQECSSKQERDLVQEFLNLYVLSVPHQLVTDSETSLVLSLNHRISSVREKAVTMLIQNRDNIDDESLLKNSLSLRLQDDDTSVVQAALAVGQDLWHVMGDDMVTVKLLLKPVLRGLTSKQWKKSAKLAAAILGGYTGDLDLDIFTGCLSCLFLVQGSKAAVEIIDLILDSALTSKHSVLKKIKEEWVSRKTKLLKKSDSIGEVNMEVATCLAIGLQQDQDLKCARLWSDLAGKGTDAKVACLMLVALDVLVTMVTESDRRLQICLLQARLVDSIEKAEKTVTRQELFDRQEDWREVIDSTSYLKSGALEKIPSRFCLKALSGVASVLTVPKQLAKASIWQFRGDESEVDLFLQVSVCLYRQFMEHCADGKPCLKLYRAELLRFQQMCFIDSALYIRFLCLLWTQHSNNHALDLGLTLTLQARSLHLGLAYMQSISEKETAGLGPTVMISLLMVMTSFHPSIRKAAVDIAALVLSQTTEQTFMFHSLLKKVVKCEGEIMSDANFIREVVRSVFKSTRLPEEGSAVSPAKTRRGRSPRRTRTTSGSQSDSEAKDVKQSALAAMMDLIVNQSTPMFVQHEMLSIASLLNNKDVLNSLLPLLERLIQECTEDCPVLTTKCLNLVVSRFSVDTVECLTAGSAGLKLFTETLKLHQAVGEARMSPQMTAISQISKDLYSSLEDASQHAILSTLFDVCVDTKQLAVANTVRKTFKHLSVNGMHIEKELKKCLNESTATTVREAKRLKRDEPAVEDTGLTEFDSRDWQRVTVVLEAVQNKKKIHDYKVMVPVSFQILAHILESDQHVGAEYIKQLILTLLYNICTRMEKLGEEEVLPEEQFNMDLIINCIRSSDNPQTHHHALLLLTAAAKIYPEHLLHNMMSVFTFMGANIMRQDDAYSFLIIGKILETVVPALITACEQRKRVPKGITNDPDDIITMVIQVFVDSYPYIPEHRRHLLFHKLLTVIGGERYLWRTLLLMMKHVVTKGTLKAELTTEPQEVSSDTEFCLNLCAEFSPAIQLSCAAEMIRYLLKLPDDKQDDSPRVIKKAPQSFGKLHKDDAKIFSVGVHTGKQLRYFRYATINLLVNLFISTDFMAQISEDEEGLLTQIYQQVLEVALQFVSHITPVANRATNTPTAKYWKALVHKSHDMLDKFVSLLPDSLFLSVIGGLMSHDLPTVQRKAMDLLNSKLQQQKELQPLEVEALLPLVDQLQNLVKEQFTSDIEETSVNCQTAFISLKLICRHIGFEHREPFIKVLKVAVEVFKHRETNLPVSSCALLCIAEVVSTLKVYVIQQLHTFMPALISVLADTEKMYRNELYLMSVITTVNKVVENLYSFISPYLQDILYSVCVLSSAAEDVDVLQKPQVQLRLKTIRTTLATNLPTRVLLPVVTSCFEKLVKSSVFAVASLMTLFSDHISHISREDLLSHLIQLQSFFLQCLDIRVNQPQIQSKKLCELEGVVIDTIITMVMKLSESTFKPFLFKVYEWATTEDEHKERILVFYKLAERLAEKLRSLFTLFAGHIISHAAKILDDNNSIKTEESFFPTDSELCENSNQLLVYILDCITKCCMYDTEGFITKERFDLLMQPLVDQLENQQGEETDYSVRVKDHLVPCIVHLCVAAQDDSLWKALNYQVCLKTRSQETDVKLSSLITLDALHKKLGEDYMPLLPDTIPFLAELMEDESEDVEKKCHEVIREMERTLGEPLQKYF